jgi:outer membrane protein assembly factor BamB
MRLKPKDFGSEQQTPVLWQDKLYGVLPRDAGSAAGALVCLDLQGKPVWTSGGERFGLGPYILAGGVLYVMDDDGVLTLVDVSSGYRQLARAKVLSGGQSWGPMALAGGRLIVRDLTRLVCLDVREQEQR